MCRSLFVRPRGLMDKAPDFGSGDCGFESHRGRLFVNILFCFLTSNFSAKDDSVVQLLCV